MRIVLLIAGLFLALAGSAAPAQEDGDDAPPPPPPKKTVCELIEESAATHRLPVGFLTRLIWRESSFRSDAVSPKGAQGIAQFMPGTAALRRLADPFDPAAAIPASAAYLAELSRTFGSLGLAAAAYNAGEKRVTDWVAGTGGLPFETRDYVFAITGRAADEWLLPEPEPVAGATPLPRVRGGWEAERCTELAARLAKPGAGTELVSTAGVVQAEWAPWGVQVAGNFSLARALASYSALQRRHSILTGRLPLIVRAVSRSRGRAPIFQVRIPAETRESAAELCRKLQASGGACVVFRN
ncbi:MAG TPA: lytic transglycosylase domain-containing protein [Bauldia sp.]|nr:lytic transglycosylase domain-containing protein [Bauldia sp.]